MTGGRTIDTPRTLAFAQQTALCRQTLEQARDAMGRQGGPESLKDVLVRDAVVLPEKFGQPLLHVGLIRPQQEAVGCCSTGISCTCSASSRSGWNNRLSTCTSSPRY